MTSILIYAREAGGADCLLPVAGILSREQGEVTAWLEEPALEIFRRGGIRSSPMPPDIGAALDEVSPDLLLTSASSSSTQSPHDRLLWTIARGRGIPSIAVVDQWQNHADRFLDAKSGESVFPDVIVVPDQSSAKVVASLAKRRADVVVTGRPGLESETGKIKPADYTVRPLRVLFVSEPLRRYLRDTLGYDEIEVLQLLIGVLTGLFGAAVDLRLRPHPANTSDDVRTMLRTDAPFPVRQDDDAEPREFHVVVGMRSVYLLKSIVAGILTLSVQPSGPADQQCVATDLGLIPRIIDAAMLSETLLSVLGDPLARQSYLSRQAAFAPTQHADRAVAEACRSLLHGRLHGIGARG